MLVLALQMFISVTGYLRDVSSLIKQAVYLYSYTCSDVHNATRTTLHRGAAAISLLFLSHEKETTHFIPTSFGLFGTAPHKRNRIPFSLCCAYPHS